MGPGGFYPVVAFNRRIPKLARTGKFGRKAFFFWTVHSPFSLARPKKMGGAFPTLETSQISPKIYLQSVAFLLNYTLRIKKKPLF